MRQHAGHTLIELLMVMLVAAVLTGVALPGLGPLLHRHRLQHACEALLHSAYYARSQAISLGRSTWLCPSRDHAHCEAATQWQHGWLVMTAAPSIDTPVVLREQASLEPLHIHSSQGRLRLRFQADGHAEGSNLTWTVCSEQRPQDQARVIVARSGRVRVEPRAAKPYPTCPP
ncbi:GspH/FimT family pseudopilin [Frateuria aurantia]|uniref:Type II secretion system protein H n=1 Tax=Frateuria aurantia (strain ATCC 33424 / DSM 6220 / KCTC 2777 / LMG 1558 / NBRC 3245 / NCIMB 13370) TaxID=767434 RepID=H8L6L8_FRAAD|nr:GspH/FimT family pseudopilin [Frateuria aurantia]AFC86834.1 prepilin-type N-terminal cleavage/methylation domain-containing protein [Frateuria aurantia DSM 6220]